MLLFCPACQAAFPGVSRCPRCGGLLLMPHEVAPDAPRRKVIETPEVVPPGVTNRLIMGTLLALGGYMAVRRLLDGILLAVDPASQAWWQSSGGLLLIHSIQIGAVIFGSMVAGAGLVKAPTVGLCVGAVCGGLFVGHEYRSGSGGSELLMILQLPALALIGALGGLIGVWVWEVPHTVAVPFSGSSKLSSIQLKEVVKSGNKRSTDWARVLIGTVVIVFGTVLAEDLREGIEKYSAGLFKAKSLAQSEFIRWQIAVFSALIGGGIAGASTGSGIRHGVIAGVLGGFGVFGLCVQQGKMFPAVSFYLERLGLDGLPFSTPGVIACVVGSSTILAMLGGWMGGSLFLPLAPPHMRRRTHGGMD